METAGMGLFGIGPGGGGMGKGSEWGRDRTGQDRTGQDRTGIRPALHIPLHPDPPSHAPSQTIPQPPPHPSQQIPPHSTQPIGDPPSPTHTTLTYGSHQSSPHHSHPALPHPTVALPNVREGQAATTGIFRQVAELREFIQAVKSAIPGIKSRTGTNARLRPINTRMFRMHTKDNPIIHRVANACAVRALLKGVDSRKMVAIWLLAWSKWNTIWRPAVGREQMCWMAGGHSHGLQKVLCSD